MVVAVNAQDLAAANAPAAIINLVAADALARNVAAKVKNLPAPPATMEINNPSKGREWKRRRGKKTNHAQQLLTDHKRNALNVRAENAMSAMSSLSHNVPDPGILVLTGRALSEHAQNDQMPSIQKRGEHVLLMPMQTERRAARLANDHNRKTPIQPTQDPIDQTP